MTPAPRQSGSAFCFASEPTAATVGRVITPDLLKIDDLDQSPRSFSDQDPHWFEMAAFGGLGAGTNMAFRKHALPNQRFFDERLGRGAFEIGEESCAFAWLLSHGHRIVYVPSAIVYHPPHGRANSCALEAMDEALSQQMMIWPVRIRS